MTLPAAAALPLAPSLSRLPLPRPVAEALAALGTGGSPIAVARAIWATLGASQRTAVWFTASSFAVWGADDALELSLSGLTGSGLAAAAIAWIASSVLCFALNRRVFGAAGSPILPAALRYAILAVLLLAGAYGGTALLGAVGVPSLAGGMTVDWLLSSVDYAVEERYIHVPLGVSA